MKPTAVKFAAGSADVLDILAVPFGGHLAGKDSDGEYFSDATDLCLDWYPVERPLLFGHGMDGDDKKGTGPGVSVVGRVDSATARKDVDGWWVQAQLDAGNRYYESIKELIGKGGLYASSGAMPHLVKRGKGGEVQRWPWVELSLTPTPANLYAVVEAVDVAKHYKSAGIAFKAALDADALDKLNDSDFAYIDSDGGRHLPIHDAAHVRAAMARFGQTKFDSDDDKQAAAKKIIAAAKKLDIDVSDDSAVAEAAKSAKATAHTAMKNHYHTHSDGTEHSHAHSHAEGESGHDSKSGQHKAVKADVTPDPDQVPADGDDGDAPEGSCEDWLQDLNRLLNRGLGGPFGDAYAYTVATFGLNGPGYCIVCVGQYDYDDYSNDHAYYRVEFDADDQSEPVLGAVTPMDRVYIPAKSSGLTSAEPLILAATTAIKQATIVRQRTRDLAERRIKEGRTLSTANVQRLQALQKTLTEAAGEIEDLLGSATPPAKAASPALLQMLDLRTRQSRLRLVE